MTSIGSAIAFSASIVAIAFGTTTHMVDQFFFICLATVFAVCTFCAAIKEITK